MNLERSIVNRQNPEVKQVCLLFREKAEKWEKGKTIENSLEKMSESDLGFLGVGELKGDR